MKIKISIPMTADVGQGLEGGNWQTEGQGPGVELLLNAAKIHNGMYGNGMFHQHSPHIGIYSRL